MALKPIFFFVFLLLAACTPPPNELYCETVDDCACGTHTETGECFLGNWYYVDEDVQCPDFCSGIEGNIGRACVDNTCTTRLLER